MPAMKKELSITEELVVLAYRSQSRKRQAATGSNGSFHAMLRASLIIELIEHGRVVLVRQQDERADTNTYGLRVVSRETTGHRAQDALIARIDDPDYAAKALSWWINDGDALRAAVDDLVENSVMVERRRSFGPFTYDYRLEPVDTNRDDALRDRFEAVYYNGHEPTDRECLAAAIIYYADMWPYYAPLGDSTARRAFHERIEGFARRRRAPVSVALGIPDDDVAAVLDTLIIARSGGGH